MKAIKILGLLLIHSILIFQTSNAQSDPEAIAAIERAQTRIDNIVNQSDIRGATATYYWGGEEFVTITSGVKKAGVSVEAEGKFMLRSFTKLLVSTIILQLQEEGSLSIDDEIGSYLNSINNVDSTITIRELLSMRANVCDFMSPSWEFLSQTNPAADLNPVAILNSLIPDGTCNTSNDYEYNDTNFQLLGLIIESVTGNSGESEFENRLFSHLEEHSLALAPIDLPEDELNGTWSIVGGNITDVGAASKNSVLTAHKFNGGVVGTTEDALRMLIEIMEGDILTKESLELMTDIDSNGYGFGMMNRLLEGDEVFGHGGSGLHLSRTFYNPELKIGLSLAVNYSINQQNNAEKFLLNNYLEMKTCRENGGCDGRSFYQKKSEWQSIVDETWGNTIPLSEKQSVFNTYADFADEYFTLFAESDFDWDSLRTVYFDRITSDL
ncbi:MAG: serine hydrolase domain-containing protein, partial [Balneolaceae bacterium]